MIINYRPEKIEECRIQTKIVLTDDEPVASKPRRLAPLEMNVVNQQVSDWLDEGIIQASDSEYASPVVVVRKKSGDYPVCIDYRKLNKKLMKDRFPLPLIADQLSNLAGSRFFSTVDLKNGFFHVPVHPESRKFTAFVTHNGQYEFRKTPFGLSTAPNNFCRFVQDVFREPLRKGVIRAYMDDILVPSKDEKENLEKLKLVFDVAQKNGLEFNWEK